MPERQKLLATVIKGALALPRSTLTEAGGHRAAQQFRSEHGPWTSRSWEATCCPMAGNPVLTSILFSCQTLTEKIPLCYLLSM